MLLLHCPNCQYDNKAGAPFCARCGVPLDLKSCPAGGTYDAMTATPANPNVVPPPLASPARAMRAWPLIVVATAAGGLPLLWMYRDRMPLPRAWQLQAQNAPASVPTPVAPPTQLPPAASVAAPAPVPASVEPGKRDAKKNEPARKNAASSRVAREAAEAELAKRPVQSAPPAAPQAAEPTTAPKEAAPTSPKCTPGLATIGFCDPQATH